MALAEPAPFSLPVRLRLVAEVLAAYAPLYRSMRRDSIETTVASARDARGRRSRLPGEDPDVLALRLGHVTSRTLALLPTDHRCLVRSLVVLRLLARRSLAGTLVIGVRRTETFAAHAWVEHGGQPILPTLGYDRLLEL